MKYFEKGEAERRQGLKGSSHVYSTRAAGMLSDISEVKVHWVMCVSSTQTLTMGPFQVQVEKCYYVTPKENTFPDWAKYL